jgi:glycosyltransferase involved in cell wall biosynthesis
MDVNPLISIIVLSYNNSSYIFDTINSILQQNYRNIELIITDDGTEGFNKQMYVDYILKNRKENITNLIVHKNEVNLGTVKNVNNAIQMSKGEYIKIIAADDVFYDGNVISSFVAYFKKTDSIIVASKIDSCDSKLVSSPNDFYDNLEFNLTKLNSKQCFIELCKGNFIPAPGVCFTRKLFAQYGYFDQNYRLMEDWPMWLRLTRNGCKIDFLNIISAKYRAYIGTSTTPSKMFKEDYIKCFYNEIRPYKDILGYRLHKKLIWHYGKRCEFDNHSNLLKVFFLIRNIDAILFYLLPRLCKNAFQKALTPKYLKERPGVKQFTSYSKWP